MGLIKICYYIKFDFQGATWLQNFVLGYVLDFSGTVLRLSQLIYWNFFL